MPHAPAPKTVLVIEDDDLVSEVTGTVLEQNGYQVIQVGSGEAALDVIIDGPAVDLLVTDVNLPGGLSGWGIANWFSVLHPGRPVLYASGAGGNPARQVENSRFLPKPFRPAQLAEAVAGLA